MDTAYEIHVHVVYNEYTTDVLQRFPTDGKIFFMFHILFQPKVKKDRAFRFDCLLRRGC
jgi:hypothetical protein